MTDAQAFAQLHKLTPAEAVAYLQRRGQLALTYGWQDLWEEEHALQFTVSRLTRLDLMQTLQEKIIASVQGDMGRRDYLRDAREALQEAGWWGAKEVVEPATGEILQTKFDASRLNLIFDVNTRQANAAGLWERMQRTKRTHPYARYITKNDERVREAHRAWHNVTLPIDHPFWLTHWCPNGYRCRCRIVAVSQAEYDRGVTPTGEPMVKAAPEIVWRDWQNRRTGETIKVPVGIDPGFAYNAGIAGQRAATMQVRVNERLSSAPPGLADAARRAGFGNQPG
ncbi:MAG TPA: phage minor head protein [Roseateles sp.]